MLSAQRTTSPSSAHLAASSDARRGFSVDSWRARACEANLDRDAVSGHLEGLVPRGVCVARAVDFVGLSSRCCWSFWPASAWRNTPGASFSGEDLLDPAGLYSKLQADKDATRPNPGRRIWSLTDDSTRDELAQTVAEAESLAFGNPLATRLAGMLNRLLSRRDLYDSTSWSAVRLESEASELLAGGIDSLSEEQLARLNRLLIESAYPIELRPLPRSGAVRQLLGIGAGHAAALRKDFVIKTALVLLANFVVGMIGIFCGIVVTASIIPQTFEPGAIDLLLSKPVSRPLLFLTKFVGGCAFTLINAAYILGGLWLVVGLRHGIWYHSLAMCIPVFLVVFAVYYAVSALAGVIWRNTIVSVVVTFLFWGICWVPGVRQVASSSRIFSSSLCGRCVSSRREKISSPPTNAARSSAGTRPPRGGRRFSCPTKLCGGGRSEALPAGRPLFSGGRTAARRRFSGRIAAFR